MARCVLKDSEDQVWVGFFGGGLGLYDPQLQSIQLFNVLAKFPSNTCLLYTSRTIEIGCKINVLITHTNIQTHH